MRFTILKKVPGDLILIASDLSVIASFVLVAVLCWPSRVLALAVASLLLLLFVVCCFAMCWFPLVIGLVCFVFVLLLLVVVTAAVAVVVVFRSRGRGGGCGGDRSRGRGRGGGSGGCGRGGLHCSSFLSGYLIAS